MWYGKYEEDEPVDPPKKKTVDEQSGLFYGKGFNNGSEEDIIENDDDHFMKKSYD